MVRSDLRGRKLRDISELSQFWDAEDFIRNFELEMERLERGLGHMVWDAADRRVTTWLSPLPVTPKFEANESEDEVTLRVHLPDVDKDKVKVGVDSKSIEVFACSRDVACRPYFLSLDIKGTIQPDSAELRLLGDELEVRARKPRRKRLEIR